MSFGNDPDGNQFGIHQREKISGCGGPSTTLGMTERAL